ncbi:MAG: alpha/beta hydrolase [Woeseiaceae bacterium]
MFRSALLLFLAGAAFADGTLSEDIRISSNVLGYDLQYRVYLPEGFEVQNKLPVLYVTDGHFYLDDGRMDELLDRLVEDAEIEPLVAIFVDARDPDDLKVNRRNAQFLCNRDYLKFYVDELLPRIETDYPVATSRRGRTVMGLSFGATNAACFGLFGSAAFSGVAMQSPANHPLPDLLPAFEEAPKLPLRIFLSTGKPDDNTTANRKFHRVLKDKGYDMQYVEVRQGHNWKNWRPLLDDVLRYFYAN